MNDARKFDLNIEKILEDWEICNAIREVVANAIDEELLTKSQAIQIIKDGNRNWHIRDFGRGIKYEHFTQKENDEKLSSPNTIGKFGIGLKDALATFDRKGVNVIIKSRFGDITLGKSEKHDFKDILTLHAYVHEPSHPDLIGTEFIVKNCPDLEIEKAKELFLRFSGERIIESTGFGDVLQKKGDTARIYVNGVRVAEEENFLFSYNITSLTKAIRKALNRERTNVGRTAYTDRVKSILLDCVGKKVAKALVDDLKNFDEGTIHDELQWTDISVHACKLLNSFEKVVFFTPDELIISPEIVERAKSDGYEIITIPESVREKIHGSHDISGEIVMDMTQFKVEWNNSFDFEFISEEEMNQSEKEIYLQTNRILELIGGKPREVRKIKISKTMRLDDYTLNEANGIWEPSTGTIIVKRDQLNSLRSYAGILLHEVAHVKSAATDICIEFEDQLTEFLGIIAAKGLKG